MRARVVVMASFGVSVRERSVLSGIGGSSPIPSCVAVVGCRVGEVVVSIGGFP